VWNHSKARLGKVFIETKEHLVEEVRNILKSIQMSRDLILSFFQNERHEICRGCLLILPSTYRVTYVKINIQRSVRHTDRRRVERAARTSTLRRHHRRGERQLNGGFGSAIVESLSDTFAQGRLRSMPRVTRKAINNRFTGVAGTQHYLRQLYGLTLAGACTKFLAPFAAVRDPEGVDL
jgi:hypothetical protein